MTTRIGSTSDEILATWERSTARPVPPFVVPAGRRWRSTWVLLLTAILAALLAGALIVGPLGALRTVGPSLETGFISLGSTEVVEFRLRLEVTTPDGIEGLVAEGVAVPRDGTVTATGWTLRPGSEWPFGGVGTGALVFADGRLFIRHGTGPWDEIEPDPRGADGPADALSNLLNAERLSAALLAAAAASERVSSEPVACGDQRCARHEFRLDRTTTHALVEAATGLEIDAPAEEVSPLAATVVVGPDGRIVSLDAGFSENDGAILFHLELEPLDVAPAIEPPLP